MPDIKELLAIANEKQKKKFSRGNRPDLLVDTGRSSMINSNTSNPASPQSIEAPYSHNKAPQANESQHPINDKPISVLGDSCDLKIQNNKSTQSQHKVDTIADTKTSHMSAQSRHNDDTKSTQTEHSTQNKSIQTGKSTQSRHKVDTVADTEPGTNADTKNVKNDHFLSAKMSEQQVNSLSKNELRIVVHLFEEFIESASYSFITTYEKISHFSAVSMGSTPTTTKRLVTKGYISKSVPLGRGKKEIQLEASFDAIKIYAKNRDYLKLKANKVDTNAGTEPGTNAGTNLSSKLVSTINNNLTNSLEPKFEKPTWFKDLNFTAVHPIGPMQVNSSIRDLVQERLNPDTVQEFLNKFKSWLAQQSRIQNPLAMFCEKLKELAVEGDSAILACMTEEERQIELEFAQQIEKAKAEMALIAKSKEHSAKQEFESRFESWYAQTSRSEHESLQASTGLIEYGSEIYKNVLRQKFREQQEG